MEYSTMNTPINSGLGDAEPWDATDYREAKTCDAGHRYSPHKPCPICGASSEERCNGGEYVSEYLRAAVRNQQQVAQAMRRRNRITEVERDARNGR